MELTQLSLAHLLHTRYLNPAASGRLARIADAAADAVVSTFDKQEWTERSRRLLRELSTHAPRVSAVCSAGLPCAVVTASGYRESQRCSRARFGHTKA